MTAIARLLDIMVRLRDPDGGCPWDRKQTYATIIPFTVEEVYEVVDAVERGDMQDLREELGDLLFQVVFLARIAEEEGHFDFDAVAQAISDKLTRRHPHVFGNAEFHSEEELSRAWEAHKAQERKDKQPNMTTSASHLDGIAATLPALLRAQKLQSRAAKVGFDWPSIHGVLDKIREEVGEFTAEVEAGSSRERLEDELGDLLFSCVNAARHVRVDPETALRRANRRFEARFRHMEAHAQQRGVKLAELSAEEFELLWVEAKRALND